LLHGQLPGEADFTELAKASAALNGITVAEAIRRAELQGRIIDLQNRYLERFPNEFAGIVIEPSPTRYTFKVLLKGGPKNALLDLAKSPDLAALGREEAVARSFTDLQREQVRLLDALETNGVRAASSINLAENSVSVVVPDKARVDALIANGTLVLPGFAAVRQGNPTVIDDATIRGGWRWKAWTAAARRVFQCATTAAYGE
jgi:hypothetical protein